MYIKKPPTKELPCVQCGIMVTVSSHARSALCNPHRTERYPNRYKDPEPTVAEILASEMVEMVPDYAVSIEEQLDKYFPVLAIPTIDDFQGLKMIRRK